MSFPGLPIEPDSEPMLAYVLKRVGIGLLTLLAASIVVFAVLQIIPGDPARLMLGMNATEDAVQALREQMGLERTARRALSPLDGRHARWRFRPFLHLFRSRPRSRQGAHRRLPAAGPHVAVSCRRSSHFPSASFRRPAAARRRHDRHGHGADRHRRAEFLVRHDACLHLRRRAAARTGRRLPRLEWRPLAGRSGR